ncbi:hypothetical protein ABZ372_54800, partial [Streptomyces sp. NPDC005921]
SGGRRPGLRAARGERTPGLLGWGTGAGFAFGVIINNVIIGALALCLGLVCAAAGRGTPAT